MKSILNKIPKPLMISLLVIIVSIAILLVSNKTGLSKKILNILNREVIEENKSLKKANDEINKKRISDSINYTELLLKKSKEIEEQQIKYNNSLLIIKKYEKAINDYRTGDFNNNFSTFTDFLSSGNVQSN